MYNYYRSKKRLGGWLDGTDRYKEGRWVDSAGNPLTFFNWRSDQPDNRENEHYIHYRATWGGQWNDQKGDFQDHIVCQKPSIQTGEFENLCLFKIHLN